MKILITGGSGFIGTNLVQYYIDNNTEVLNLDIVSPKLYQHRQFWKKVDLLDRDQLTFEVKEFSPTHVVHLAAKTDLSGGTVEDYSVNTTGTQNLISALNNLESIQKVIFASSMLVCSVGHIPATDGDYSPANPYGESKKQMELMLRATIIPGDWLIIRPTSIWGPWFGTPYRDFFDKVFHRKYFNIKGRACTKTYGFVLNSIYQIDQLLKKQTQRSKVYYVGDAPPINISVWADQIAGKLGMPRFKAVPYYIFKMAALVGDVLNIFGIKFPMTSFRLRNMTTNNILSLEETYAVVGPTPYDIQSAIDITLGWINSNKKGK